MCGDGSDNDSSSAGGATGGIGFSDTSAAEASSQAAGKSAAGGIGAGSVDEQITAIREKEKTKAKKSGKTGEVVGTILGFLSPVPGGSVIGRELGGFVDRQSSGTTSEQGSTTGASSTSGSASGGGDGDGDGGGVGGGERELTSFPSREAAAKTVLASEQDKRRALRGRKSTILTSPRGVSTEAPGRKTLLGQ